MNNEELRMKNSKNILREKSYSFALKIIHVFKELKANHKEFILSTQMLRSATAIGAMIRESEYAQSKADFINKLNVALKEANETDYWLNLLSDSGYLDRRILGDVLPSCAELLKILISSIKTAKGIP